VAGGAQGREEVLTVCSATTLAIGTMAGCALHGIDRLASLRICGPAQSDARPLAKLPSVASRTRIELACDPRAASAYWEARHRSAVMLLLDAPVGPERSTVPEGRNPGTSTLLPPNAGIQPPRRRSAAMTGGAAHREVELDISRRSQSACHCLDDHCPPGLNTPRTVAIVRARTS